MIDARRTSLAALESARAEDVSIVTTAAATVIVIAHAPASDIAPTLSVTEAATVAKTSARVVKESIRSGALEASGTTRTRVIERAALLRWMASRKVRVPSPDDDLVQRANEIASTTDADGVEVRT